MSTANAKIGSAIDPQAAEEKTPPGPAHRPTPDFVQDYGPLLAQIPDLDLKTTPNAPKRGPKAGSSARRYRSSWFSAWGWHW